MSDIFIPDLIEETPNGVFARHAGRFTLPVLIAPTTDDRADAHNRLRRQLVTVACANLSDYNFDFDSSFLAPRVKGGLEKLMRLVKLYPGSPLSIFGHADPDGKAAYNKHLSERRAQALFGLLLRRISVWEHLYTLQDGAPGDIWGKRSLQVMLQELKFEPGNVEGNFDGPTRQALRAFLDSVDGKTIPAQDTKAARAKLFEAYMDAITPIDSEKPGVKWRLSSADFLSGAPDGMGTPGDVQGCSFFNLQMVLAKQEENNYAKAGKPGETRRHRANVPNRRVVIYLFEKGTKKPKTWPCPPASKGITGCEERFWVDGKDRHEVKFEAHRRRFGKAVPPGREILQPPNFEKSQRFAREETTFSCRFYHGVALHSPCERDLKMWVLRLWAGGPDAPLANANYAATVGTDANAPVIRGTTTASGILGLPLFDDEVTITLRVDVGPAVTKGFPPSRPGIVVPPTNRPAPRNNVQAGDLTNADNVTADKPEARSTDSQAFPGESQFLALTLTGGRLLRVKGPTPEVPKPDDPDPDPGAEFDVVDVVVLSNAERNQGAGQRLRNLAFGGAELETDATRRRDALKEFQLLFRRAPNNTGDLDTETIDRLHERHGEVISAERPPT
ncbi:MAG: OmpA family protein [Cytophagaceae bacterium]|nr:OmpA family protein [Gemmatimonadaceae bacterium]